MNENRPYCYRQNCNQLNVLFSDVQITLILLGIPPLGLTIRIQWAKMTIFNLCTWKYLPNGKSYGHSRSIKGAQWLAKSN